LVACASAFVAPSGSPTIPSLTVLGSAKDSTGLVGSIGVAGVISLTSLDRSASRFFSAVRRKTLIVVRSDLFGLQSSADKGECSQTGHEEGSED
jgi:hypothetical protein